MEFLARSIGDGCECRLLNDDEDIIFHLKVPENTIEYWTEAFERWLEKRPEKLGEFAAISGQSAQCKFPEESEDKPSEMEPVQLTFLKIMCALARALDALALNEKTKDLLKVIQQFLDSNRVLNIVSMYKDGIHSYGFVIFDRSILLRLNAKNNSEFPLEWWSLWLVHETVSREFVLEILRNGDLLDEIVYQRTQMLSPDASTGLLLLSYASFLKALVKFLDEIQDGESIPFRRKIAYFCASVVKNENADLEEQKGYLERIFVDHNLGPRAKYLSFRGKFVLKSRFRKHR